MVGTQYQAEVPSCLCHYKDGEKGNCFLFCISHEGFFFVSSCLSPQQKQEHLSDCNVLYSAVYEDEDELLWSPGTLPENKVRSFLSDVLSRTTDEKTAGGDKAGIHVRDNEQVSQVFVLQAFYVGIQS